MKLFILIIFQTLLSKISCDLSLDKISELILNHFYEGVWTSPMKTTQPFHFLTHKSGKAYLSFLAQDIRELNQSNIIDSIQLQLLDPQYQENNEIIGQLLVTNYNAENISWQGESLFNYTANYHFSELKRGSCGVNYTISVMIDYMEIVLAMKGDNCPADFHVILGKSSGYQTSIIFYFLNVTLCCIIQFLSFVKLNHSLSLEEQDKYSLYTLGYILFHNCYISIQDITFAIQNYMFFYYFLAPAFFFFLLSATQNLRMLNHVWKSMHFYESPSSRSQNKFKFRVILVVYFFVYIISMSIFDLSFLFIFLTSFFILPQIMHNYLHNSIPENLYLYSLGIVMPQMMHTLYFRLYAFNFRGLQPSNLFAILYIGSFLIQVCFMFTQRQFGARWFVPTKYHPQTFEYYQEWNETDECAICLSLIEDKKIMVTPCHHHFHIECLKSWMHVKMQCPTCRRPLPR